VSIVSAWEIAIKVSIGKMSGLKCGIHTFINTLENMPVRILPIHSRHIEAVEILPFIHRDPFDRLLIATAKAEGITILTADENIPKYDVPSVW
jgi:PIN domain nuclease of toxin-antitoxin system